jgi:hypothetical protein
MIFDDNFRQETADHGRKNNRTFAEQEKPSTVREDASLDSKRDAPKKTGAEERT